VITDIKNTIQTSWNSLTENNTYPKTRQTKQKTASASKMRHFKNRVLVIRQVHMYLALLV